ncbi:MAG TPA: GDSL-type esterase/lipase family protein [Tepidisphaeraceae bacterium]|jgi:lysophospholipase L1-like esterase/acetyl esterase/lipase|nr:GDSL-type esterase/lipase family protein [Tepidisphaeraceae bacterium]
MSPLPAPTKRRFPFFLALIAAVFAYECRSVRGDDVAKAQEAIAPPAMSRDAKGVVMLSDATPGVTIGYTLDGSDPDRSAGEYLAPIDLAHGGVVKARAFSRDYKQKSERATQQYQPLPGNDPLPSTLVPVTQSRNWASYEWPKRHHIVCDAVRDKHPRVVFIGDSITHNFNQLVWHRAYDSYHAVNAGFGWDRTENVLWRLQHGELDQTSPEVVVVMIGTNNMDLNTAPEIAAGVGAVCGEVHARQPKAKILLLGIFPRGPKPDATRAKVAETNKLLANLDGHDGVTFLDISPTFVNADGTISKDVLQDYLHPSRKGYVMWVDAMQPTLSKLLGEPPRPSLAQANLPATDLSELATSLVAFAPAQGSLPGELQLKEGDQIVAMGDSITQDGGYLRNVDAILAAQYPSLKLPKIINVGISGQKAEDMVARFQRDVVDRKPAFVTISVGTNDVMHRLNAPHDEKVLATYADNVSKMVEMAQAAGIKVILLTPALIQEEPTAEGNQRMAMYVGAEKKIAAEKKCTIIDLRDMFLKALAAKPAGETEKWITRDGVHMNPRGDALMAVAVLKGLGVANDKICAADAAPSATQHSVIPVWPGVAPGSEDWKQTEVEYANTWDHRKMVRNVTHPTITAYFPEPSKANGTAVIIAPGGGFRFLSWDNEGTAVAEWLAARGVTAFVLKYRLLDTGESQTDFEKGKKPTPAANPKSQDIASLASADGRQAMKVVREHAAEWKLAPNRIGIMGFSAGGVVAMGVVTEHDAQSRPDFAAPIYGAVPVEAVAADAPPLFLLCAADDKSAADASAQLARKWNAAGRVAELHIYSKGGHGFGMSRRGLPVDHWIERFGDWLDVQGLMKPRN